MNNYKSLKVSYKNNKHEVSFITNKFRELKKKEVLVKVKYSGLNYKDALSVSGTSRIIRNDSLIPGLDFSGIVAESNSRKFSKGERVLATGGGLGETIDGGFSQYVYVPENILIHIPQKLSLLSSMQIGTAGFTAAIAIEKMLLNKQNKNLGPIVVTGATGAVGSISINILNNIGFDTVAITRKNKSTKYLKSIGAKEIVKFNKNIDKKVLDKKIFAGSIDSVGGEILDWIIKSTKDNGNIVSVGMASSPKLNTTIFPLIIRNINLLGISSTNYPYNRKNIWEKLSKKYKPSKLNIINTKCINLENVVNFSKKILLGKNIGKIVIKIS